MFALPCIGAVLFIFLLKPTVDCLVTESPANLAEPRQMLRLPLISLMMEVHVYLSVENTLRCVSKIRYTSTHLIHNQIDQGMCLTNYDTHWGHS
jgi:hypothetical protein